MIGAEDERSIIAVLLRYATGIDRRDRALLRSCFTADFQGDYGDFGYWRSGDEIADFMERSHAAMGHTLHRMTNIVIEGEGDRAAARSYVDALLMPGDPSGPVHRASGWYEDELVRTAEGWRLARRKFVGVAFG
jgi:hypothetical protein